MRFLGPGLSDRIPDARTIWLVPGETAGIPAGGTALVTKAAVAFREGLEFRPNSRCAELSHTILIIVAGVRCPSGVTSVNAG